MRGSIFCALLIVGTVGCDHGSSPTAKLVREGALSLALSATSRDGAAFRLRNANFHLSGCSDDVFRIPAQNAGAAGSEILYGAQCTDITLSTEDHLDQDVITERLLPGSYSVMLDGDWYLEQQVASGAWVPAQQVVLLSPHFQQTHVSDGAMVQLSFVFGVGGDPIDFRHGDLGIDIQIERPSDHACDGFAGSGPELPSACQVAGSGLGSAGVGVPAGSGG